MQTDTIRLRELKITYQVKTDARGEALVVGGKVNTARDCAQILMAQLQEEPSEVFAILCLTTKNSVIGYHEVSRGTLDSTLAHPREIFRAALLANAAAIVLAHNHPSGDPRPSPDDLVLTHRVVAAGELLGITVYDHVIVGDGRHFSLREAGLL